VCFARICGRAIFSPDEHFFFLAHGLRSRFFGFCRIAFSCVSADGGQFSAYEIAKFSAGCRMVAFFQVTNQVVFFAPAAASATQVGRKPRRRGVLQCERIDAARDSRHRSAGRARSERCIRVATLARNWRVAEARLACAFLVRGWGPRELQNRQAQYARPATNFVTDAQVGLTERLRATLDVSERVVQNFTNANSEQQESRLKRDDLDREH